MKKTVTFILVFCCLINTLCLNIRATEELDPDDSRYISPEMAEAICDEDTIITIRAYKGMISSDFGSYSSIEEIVSRADDIKYLQENADGWCIVGTDWNGEYQKFKAGENGHSFNPYATQEFKTGEAIKTVSPDIAVQEIYYLDSEDCYEGSAIFYRTNLGDYVYASFYSLGERLFAAEVFWEYIKAVRMVHRAKYKREMVTGGPNYKICDLSAYDFRSPDFDPDKPLPEIEMPKPKPKAEDYLWPLLIAVPLAAILGIWAVRKRKPKDVVDNIV